MKLYWILLIAIVSLLNSAQARDAVCDLPPTDEEDCVPCACKGTMTVWSYMKDENACQSWEYGGCSLQGNKFDNKDCCERACLSD